MAETAHLDVKQASKPRRQAYGELALRGSLYKDKCQLLSKTWLTNARATLMQ